MFDKLKAGLLNVGMKFISVDEKIVRMFFETKPSRFKKIVIMPAVKFVMKKLIDELDSKRKHGRVFNGVLNNTHVSIVRSLVGAPNAAIAIECLKRCNVDTIIRIDFCGGLDKINIGDILIPERAYCGDGTSPNYLMKYPTIRHQLNWTENPFYEGDTSRLISERTYQVLPNKKLMKLFLTQFSQLKKVNLWSTDALFCETNEFINTIKKLNINAVDMETSILYLLGKIYNIKTVSVLSVSDLPGHEKYDFLKQNNMHPDMERGIKNAIKLLIKLLPKISRISRA
ncbi:MAG: hypothetical protein R6U96_11050 [Promethearchaeia archaeon]